MIFLHFLPGYCNSSFNIKSHILQINNWENYIIKMLHSKHRETRSMSVLKLNWWRGTGDELSQKYQIRNVYEKKSLKEKSFRQRSREGEKSKTENEQYLDKMKRYDLWCRSQDLHETVQKECDSRKYQTKDLNQRRYEWHVWNIHSSSSLGMQTLQFLFPNLYSLERSED